ncbi:carbohydrate ABC transporter permease [Actinomyces ruminis]|uniref:carbohydrate ABC transporter permease n=1 Tax=Actinomyces ruminis TaxID=1937003 RepID=UPI00211EE0AC|nr:hypothetical protein [Actinomyces ruminis]
MSITTAPAMPRRSAGTSTVTSDERGTHAIAKRWTRRRRLLGLAFLVPALVFYTFFVLVPICRSFQYSFYSWNGVTEATWVGWDNYRLVFADPRLFSSILHAFELIVFFSILPVLLALVTAAAVRGIQRHDSPT